MQAGVYTFYPQFALSVYTAVGVLSKTLIVILVLLALNALAYGVFFVTFPAEGLREFGFDSSGGTDDGAIFLIGMVGIGFLGCMSFAILAIALIFKRNRSGLAVTLVLGTIYLAIGIYTIANQLWVDALIYGGFGSLISLLAGLVWKSTARATFETRP